MACLALSACGPRPSPGPAPVVATHRPPPVCWKYPNNPANVAVQMSIQQAFGPYGQAVVDQAGRVACCESGWGPQAGWPNAYYKGLFQLGTHIVAIHNYGGQFFDAFSNAQAARDLYVSRGHNWSAWTCQP